MHWRLVHTPPLDGVDNMAFDQALLERAQSSGEGVVRVYSWRTPTLSFGRNQTALHAYDARLASAHGVDVVRRPTGGRALLHHHEVTYSVTAPIVPGDSLRRWYEIINRALVGALARLGAYADIAPAANHARAKRAPVPGIAPCFEQPSEGELMLNGRKLVGSALYREGGAFLQHGSILIDDDQQLIASLARVDVGPVPRAATLREVVDDATPERFADALFQEVRSTWDASPEPLRADDSAYLRMAALRSRYADDAWTWRR